MAGEPGTLYQEVRVTVRVAFPTPAANAPDSAWPTWFEIGQAAVAMVASYLADLDPDTYEIEALRGPGSRGRYGGMAAIEKMAESVNLPLPEAAPREVNP